MFPLENKQNESAETPSAPTPPEGPLPTAGTGEIRSGSSGSGQDGSAEPPPPADPNAGTPIKAASAEDRGAPPILDNQFKMSDAVKEELTKCEWYHDAVPQEDVEIMLTKDGDFLLRTGEDGQPMFSFRHRGQCITILIRPQETNGSVQYTIDGLKCFKSVVEALSHYHKAGEPIFDGGKVLRPILKQDWELSRENLTLNKKIGEGAFGEVYCGELAIKRAVGDLLEVKIAVAVKLIHGSKEADKKYMLQKMHEEARFMRQYSHPNLVRLRGVLFSNDDTMIVMELVNGGGLDKYLRTHLDVSMKVKCSFAYDVAAGLAYLHEHFCMHRDIAARNCLVSDCGPMVKLSDFGLSRRGTMCMIAPQERIPMKWQAPEVLLKLLYVRESDVWSYGVLVWEIFNNGRPPYQNMDNKFIRASIEFIRLPDIPEPHLNMLMKRCWENNYRNRPPMYYIEKELQKYCIHKVTDWRPKRPSAPEKKRPNSAEGGKRTVNTKKSIKQKSANAPGIFLLGHRNRKSISADAPSKCSINSGEYVKQKSKSTAPTATAGSSELSKSKPPVTNPLSTERRTPSKVSQTNAPSKMQLSEAASRMKTSSVKHSASKSAPSGPQPVRRSKSCDPTKRSVPDVPKS